MNIALIAAALSLAAVPACAAQHRRDTPIGVVFGHPVARASGAHPAGGQLLVSDGPGTAFGFHHAPMSFRLGSLRERQRQANATHEAVVDDALTSGGYWGFPGDSVYGAGNRASYGVFNGADGYGSPFFAGYYGPGDGADFGPFGRAYAN